MKILVTLPKDDNFDRFFPLKLIRHLEAAGEVVWNQWSRQFSAVLDVFVEEPLPDDSPLRRMCNVILTPHVSGVPSQSLIGEAMVEEVERYIAGADLRHEIPVEQFRLMTR